CSVAIAPASFGSALSWVNRASRRGSAWSARTDSPAPASRAQPIRIVDGRRMAKLSHAARAMPSPARAQRLPRFGGALRFVVLPFGAALAFGAALRFGRAVLWALALGFALRERFAAGRFAVFGGAVSSAGAIRFSASPILVKIFFAMVSLL